MEVLFRLPSQQRLDQMARNILSRLHVSLKQENAHYQLDALQSDVSSSEQKQAMKRAIAQLKRVYDRVQARTQQA
jgi:hypothetical protein